MDRAPAAMRTTDRTGTSATQIAIDLAVSVCAARGLGTPQSDADAFLRLRTRVYSSRIWRSG
jgi:hypothetical protein